MEIEKDKIGRVINLGGEHIVRYYRPDMVIKSPFGLRFILQKARVINHIESRYKLLKSYFGNYVHDTEIIIEDGNHHYVYLQKKLDGRLLSPELMKDPKVAKQFLEIVDINKKMMGKEGVTWEFFGAIGLLFTHDRYIRNCFVLPDGKVRMIDAGVVSLDPSNHPFLLKWLLKWALKKQDKYLKSFLEKSRSL